MADGFTTPPGIKIPSAVPLDQADGAKQALYGPLAAAQSELSQNPGSAELATESAPAVYVTAAAASDSEVTNQDKKDFVRCLLGSYPFKKEYKLFGSVTVTLEDSGTEATEALYTGLWELDKKQHFSDAEFELHKRRRLLAQELKQVKIGANPAQQFTAELTIEERLLKLMEFQKPLYRALLQTSEQFEQLVEQLTSKALDPNFWKTDGGASR